MTRSLQRITVAAARPDAEAIGRAADLLRRGAVAAIPTDTLYGLAVDPFSPAAVQRIFTIKDRATERALPLVAADVEQVVAHLGALPPIGQQLAERFWPGPLTLVIAAPATLSSDVTGGGTTIGVRVPAHDVTRALCAACGVPLTATSANISGQPPTSDPDEVERRLGERIDVLVDSGVTPGGAPSTIVDVTGDIPRLIRAGAIAWDHVLTTMRA